MLSESLVAVLALIAACILTPGTFFAINAPAGLIGSTVESAAHVINGWGFVVSPTDLTALAQRVHETTLLSRTGGAPSLAVGMASIFATVLHSDGSMALWYHFAIMFEALFILTTLDAGTRVGRFMLQDLGKHIWAPFGRVSWYPAVLISSALVVGSWGYFLYQGVTDPLGGVNLLWPIFGISNQLLAAIALCVGTTVIVKMGKARYSFMTILPLIWLVIVALTGGWEKIFSDDIKIGFFSHARWLGEKLAQGVVPPGIASAGDAARMMFNDRLDAAVVAIFMISVIVILVDSVRVWYGVIRGTSPAVSSEVPFTARALPAES
jgi:carbon starvation protein